MTKEKLLKELKSELASVRRDFKKYGTSIREIESLDVEDMNGNDAFNRGYYRGIECAIGFIINYK